MIICMNFIKASAHYQLLKSNMIWEDVFKAKDHDDKVRNSLSGENLESYMLLSIEKELLDELDKEAVTDRFIQASNEHKRLFLI